MSDLREEAFGVARPQGPRARRQRDVDIGRSSLTAIINDAYAWGVWLRRMTKQAIINNDPVAAMRLSEMADATIVRATMLADALQHTLPEIPSNLFGEELTV